MNILCFVPLCFLLVSLASPVNANAALALVSISADRPTTSEPSETTRIAPGEFILHRTGSTERELTVFLAYAGSATSGRDYTELPRSIQFAAGVADTSLLVQPIEDSLIEGDETVIARLIPPLTSIVPSYTIDPARSSATVVIHDSNPPTTTPAVKITKPVDGAELPAGVDVEVTAVALDPNGYIPRLEFYVDGKLEDVSVITFFRAPDPGTPIQHHFVWKTPAPGEHVLTAQGVDTRGTTVTSAPVHVTLKPTNPAGATIKITAPNDGDVFRAGSDIPITAVAVDPNGYIARVEFYANDEQIGVSQLFFLRAPDPGTPITHTFVWQNVPADQYTLTARGVDAQGQRVVSPGVKILVGASTGDQVVLTVEAIDAVASEKTPDGQPDNAVFAIRRIAGRKDIDVPVVFDLTGSAINGVDYSEVKESALLPAGSDELDIVIKPIPDATIEGDETVELTLREPICPSIFPPLPQCYVIGKPGSAQAVIQDEERAKGPKIEILSPKEGEVFTAGTDIPITAAAVDPAGYIPRVEFYANDEKIGVSEIAFLRAPDPGTPITHTFLWANPKVGMYVLTARVVDSLQNSVTSPPVKITIQSNTVIGNHPPNVEIVQPKDGAYFDPGQRIEILATGSDPDGHVVSLDILADGNLIRTAKGETVTVVWSDAPAGPHKLVAHGVDDEGAESDSTPVRIMVGPTQEPGSFVERHLPGSYSPGGPLTVQLVVQLPEGAAACAVEDQPPNGWTVRDISYDGVFDPVTGKVKFGPYTDGQNRTLTYKVTPPQTATGSYEFAGMSSAGGVSVPIAGDHTLAQGTKLHPADLNQDNRMSIDEATGYAAVWKNGANWSIGPNPIPIAYVTRAGLLWRDGEAYHYDATQPAPLCWVPDQPRVTPLDVGASEFTASRGIAKNAAGSSTVTIEVNASANTSAYAVEEMLPPQSTVTAISEGGSFDSVNETVRWGVFADNNHRSLHYTLNSPAKASGAPQIKGSVSANGERMIPILGSRPWISTVERAEDHSLHLKLEGPADQVYVLETSSDLNTWTPESSLFLPDGQLDYSPDSAGTNAHRYYRLRAR